MFTTTSTDDTIVGLVQMCATNDKSFNYTSSCKLMSQAVKNGAKMIFLPECCDFVGSSPEETLALAEPIDGELVNNYCRFAKENEVWISLGGVHVKKPDDPNRTANTHILIDATGTVASSYTKTHLFDVNFGPGISFKESKFTCPGTNIVAPVDTPAGKLGLAICYDLRFAELSLIMRQQGAELLSYPSAFTVPTGQAHWEVLLRSRAIDSQCYVIAAAQVGEHNSKRHSFGHSIVVDPWGKTVAELDGQNEDILLAPISLSYLRKVRAGMPMMEHRRYDLYPTLLPNNPVKIEHTSDSHLFGNHRILSDHIFYKTTLSFAFVNISPVVPGHVLVCPLRPAKLLSELSNLEVADLFQTVQFVGLIIKRQHQVDSLTISIQDGNNAGQTVPHLHVHVLPRRSGDFTPNDAVYGALDAQEVRLKRSTDDMSSETCTLRQLIDK